MTDFKLLEKEEVAALSSPFRRELLEQLQQPDSAVNIARKNDMSRQRVGYHMRALQKAGCIEPVGERKQRGLTERLFQAIPFAYVYATSQSLPEQQLVDRFSWSSLVNMLARTLWQLVRLRSAADATGKKLATLAIHAELHVNSPAARKAFSEELVVLIDNLIAKHDDPEADSGRDFQIIIGALPTWQTRSHDHEFNQKH